MVGFVSDNVSGIHPKVMQALNTENKGYRMPYGNDDVSKQLEGAFSDLFETEVFVIPCTSGTAANSLALSLMAGAINSICVHEKSHVYVDECNAPEFYSGARLTPIGGANAKLDIDGVAKELALIGEAHSPQPSALSITQTNEIGLVYTLQEIADLTRLAHDHGLKTHMDGARFANAVATLGCSPAELSWKVGVDVLSFGATKNGCMAAEAVVIFNKDLIAGARHRQKRAGQLLSKQRFLATQLLAYLSDDLWLSNADYANKKVQTLVQRLSEVPGVELPSQVDSNMIFVKFTSNQIASLQQAELAGYVFEGGEMRLCCSWATTDAEIDAFVACVAS